MRARYLVCVLAVTALVTLGLTAQVSASTLLYDDFLGTGSPPDGTSLDTTKWTTVTSATFPNAPVVAGSVVTLDKAEMDSILTVGSGTTTTFKIGAAPSGTATTFGLSSGSKAIYVSTEFTGTSWVLATSDNWAAWTTIGVPTPAAGDFYDIVRQSTSVDLYVNGALKAHATTNLPNAVVPLPLQMYAYGASSSQGFDSVKVSEGVVISTPEPSTLVLLGIGLLSLLAYAWRKRK